MKMHVVAVMQAPQAETFTEAIRKRDELNDKLMRQMEHHATGWERQKQQLARELEDRGNEVKRLKVYLVLGTSVRSPSCVAVSCLPNMWCQNCVNFYQV